MIIRIAIFLGLLVSSAAASAGELIWHFRSEHSGVINLEFYSQNRNHVWPGNNQVYVIDDGNVHDYALECNSGEKICYGAWLRSDSSSYWGSGYGGEQRCDSCCFTCDGGPTNVMVLNR